MKEYNLVECVRLARMLPDESAYTIATLYKRLQHYAARLTTIGIHNCNGTRYQGDGEYERATQAVYAHLDKLQGEYGLWTYHQSDPRGCSLYVDITPREQYTDALGVNSY